MKLNDLFFNKFNIFVNLLKLKKLIYIYLTSDNR